MTADMVEETEVVALLGRMHYLQYCKVKGFRPTAAPYVPAWALDYARVSVDMLGWDDDGIVRLRGAAR